VRSVPDVFGERPGTRFRRVVVAGVGACAVALAAMGVAACSGDDGGSAGADGASAVTSSTTSPTTVASKSTTDAKSGPPAATTAVSVPGVVGEVAGPFPVHATGDFGNGVTARLSRIEAVDAKATLPGEFSGPAVAVTVEVTNGSAHAIDLDAVTVDLATADGASAPAVRDPDRKPLSGRLAEGASRAGEYVFTLGEAQRSEVSVRVSYAADAPTVVFSGSVRDA
jgi:hypothetical protein